jgi:spore maturation protein SpmB
MNVGKDIKDILKDTGSTYFFLLKIMIPISIIVKILEEFGAIEIIGENLGPSMGIVGLPGEFGLIIATAMITNIYGALVVFFSLSLQYTYNVAQVTILACIMLIAHTLPVEVRIAQKAGVRLWYTLTLRILGAFIFGIILNLIFSTFKLFQNENVLVWKPDYTNSTLTQWAIGQVGYYIMIFLIILSLMILMKILKNTCALDKLNNYLKPGLKFFGMSKNAAILPLIGMTLGLAYGGGFIVKEAKSKLITKKDTFLSLSFMGLSHSLIEDTLLTLAIGASLFGILLGRVLFTLIVMFIIVKYISLISNKTFEKYFMNS